METNTHICDCGRGYGETKSPSSCKWSIARKGLLCYVAKLALMSKKLFTEEEIIILKQNKYVKKVTSKGITYTDEFKRIFIDENGNGKLPRIIFEECGFNIDIIGMQRVKSSASRWRTAFKNGGAIKLTDTRKYNTGRPIEKDLSIEEKYKKLEAKMKLLQAENELLKKLDMIERRVLKKK